MATIHGNAGSLSIGGTAVGEVKSFEFTNGVAFAEDTAMGDTAETYKPGHKNGSGKAEVHYDPDDATQPSALAEGATVSLVLYPEGDTTGNETWSGDVLIENFTIVTEMKGIVAATFNWRNPLTRGTA